MSIKKVLHKKVLSTSKTQAIIRHIEKRSRKTARKRLDTTYSTKRRNQILSKAL